MSKIILFIPYYLWIFISLTTVSSGLDQEEERIGGCEAFQRHCKTCRDQEELCHRIAGCENERPGTSSTESPCKAENLQEMKAFCFSCQKIKAECNSTGDKCKPIVLPIPIPAPDTNCLQEKVPCSPEGKPSCCKHLACTKESAGDSYYCQQRVCGREGATCAGQNDPSCCQGYNCEGTEGNYKCAVFYQVHGGPDEGSSSSTGGTQDCVQHKGKCRRTSDNSDNCCHDGGFACFCRTEYPMFPFIPKSCVCEFSREEATVTKKPKS